MGVVTKWAWGRRISRTATHSYQKQRVAVFDGSECCECHSVRGPCSGEAAAATGWQPPWHWVARRAQALSGWGQVVPTSGFRSKTTQAIAALIGEGGLPVRSEAFAAAAPPACLPACLSASLRHACRRLLRQAEVEEV